MNVDFQGSSAAFTEAISCNRGPKRLLLCGRNIHVSVGSPIQRRVLVTREQCLAVFNALARNTHLTMFEYNDLFTDGEARAFATALRRNQGLAEIDLFIDRSVSIQCWLDILSSTSVHPKLVRIRLATNNLLF